MVNQGLLQSASPPPEAILIHKYTKKRKKQTSILMDRRLLSSDIRDAYLNDPIVQVLNREYQIPILSPYNIAHLNPEFLEFSLIKI